MKIWYLSFGLLILPFTFISSCNKDNSVEKTKTCRILNITIFDNETNKVEKVESFYYNEKQELIKYYDGDIAENYSYNDGLIKTVIVSSELLSDTLSISYLFYNNSYKLEYVINDSGDTSTIYIYNESNQVTKSFSSKHPQNFTRYYYDSNGNTTLRESYQNGVLFSSHDYAYGDKKNPKHDTGLPSDSPECWNVNNILYENDASYEYLAYNEYDYPTKYLRHNPGTGKTYRYEIVYKN